MNMGVNYQDLLLEACNEKKNPDKYNELVKKILEDKRKGIEDILAGTKNAKRINVADEFGAAIAARNRLLNAYSGEAFRDDYLLLAYDKIKDDDDMFMFVNFNGVLGCPPSFYDEAFIEVVRSGKTDINPKQKGRLRGKDEKLKFFRKLYILFNKDSKGNKSSYAEETVEKIYTEMMRVLNISN